MINIAVIGVGVMGSNHARLLSEMKNVNLIAVADSNQEKLNSIADKFNIKNKYLDHKEMLKKEKIDGVVIAVPAAFHKKIALDCLEKSVPVLLEKPIAHDLSDADEIIKKASEKKTLLIVGHIERFNPVVTKIKELIDRGELGEIYLVNSTRVGPFPKRLYGIPGGVLVDISVHDIDIIRYLVGEIKQVYSQMIYSGEQEIYAKNLFELDKNVKGSAEFSWISPKRMRTIEIYGMKGMLRGDYFGQELTFYENNDAEVERSLAKGHISAGNSISIPVIKQEPLKIELNHFVDCIQNKKKPLISPEDARRALEIAVSMTKSDKENKPIRT